MFFLKKKENNKSKYIKYFGLFLLICGLFTSILYYSTINKLKKDQQSKIEIFFNNESTKVETNNFDLESNDHSDEIDYNYIAVLEIPSIYLKRGLVSPNSYYNNINYNIQIIEHSTMPDIVNGNLILASHNGASYISFFKNLDKLHVNDKVYIYYQSYKYEYTINNIYDTPKDGNIEIYRDHKKTAITLITCKENTKDTQTVYIGYLTNKEQYK